jgi:hypothetical protein
MRTDIFRRWTSVNIDGGTFTRTFTKFTSTFTTFTTKFTRRNRSQPRQSKPVANARTIHGERGEHGERHRRPRQTNLCAGGRP